MNLTKTPNCHWLNQDLVLFHGTTLVSAQGIINSRIDLTLGRQALDFGIGFYTTTSEDQARGWARKKAFAPDTPALVRYEVSRNALALLEFLAFVRSDNMAHDFWDFVVYCRSGNIGHARGKDIPYFDVVVGPLVQQWKTRRTVHPDSDQLSFHTDNAVQILQNSKPQLIL